ASLLRLTAATNAPSPRNPSAMPSTIRTSRSPRLRGLLRRPLVPFGGRSVRTGQSRDCQRARHVQPRDLQVQHQQIYQPRARHRGDRRFAAGPQRPAGGFFDVAYVDGYHGYDVVVEDIANAFRLCKLGGIICGDDYDCSPEMMAAVPEEALHWDQYSMQPMDIGVHPGWCSPWIGC